MDTAQLVGFVKMAFPDSTTKEDFLTLLHLKERTRSEDIYEFKNYVRDNDIYKLVAIATNRAPAMRGVRAGFTALCRTDINFPDFVKCVIHQQALMGKVLDFSHLMTLVVKPMNSIRAKALQQHLFKAYLDELDAVYGDLIHHTNVVAKCCSDLLMCCLRLRLFFRHGTRSMRSCQHGCWTWGF